MSPAPGDPHHDPVTETSGSASDRALGPAGPGAPGSGEAPTVPGKRFEWRYQVRVSDLNPGGHVDNLHILRVADEARFHLLGRREPGGSRLVLSGCLDALPDGKDELVAANRVDYLRELWFADVPLHVAVWVCRLGRSSFDLAAEIRQTPEEPPATRLVTTFVLYDRTTGAPWELDAAVRGALAAYLGDPPKLRATG